MPRPTTRDDLLEASAAGYAKLTGLVASLTPEQAEADFAFDDRDRNVPRRPRPPPRVAPDAAGLVPGGSRRREAGHPRRGLHLADPAGTEPRPSSRSTGTCRSPRSSASWTPAMPKCRN